MKSMNPTSSRALLYFAGLVLLAGLMVGSPSGAVFALCLAALLAGIPAAFGAGRTRIVAVVLLLLAAAFAVGKYPDFKRDQEQYRQRAKAHTP